MEFNSKAWRIGPWGFIFPQKKGEVELYNGIISVSGKVVGSFYNNSAMDFCFGIPGIGRQTLTLATLQQMHPQEVIELIVSTIESWYLRPVMRMLDRK